MNTNINREKEEEINKMLLEKTHLIKKKYIIFSYENDEYMPIIYVFTHNLKSENIARCSSNKIFETENIKIYQMNTIHKNKIIDIFITYFNNTFLRGMVYCNGTEYNIINYNNYESLQIDNLCYDNISFIKLSCNIFN